ncbi:hypothetical protein [Capnocytophaga sputigena]|jgi:hypothetical protein|uniref:hypothetical protein n=1 Tax=Capnocytophaga sputigena TaxID=1019 RepID=UPI00288ADFB3|nr:hypothetical protein [Capnocytophaga sputigena]
MKKFLTILAIIALTLASCSKDKENCNCNNDNGNNGGTKTPTATIKPNQIMLGFRADLKRYNIPEFLPINYSNWGPAAGDLENGIHNEPTILNPGNKTLEAFYKKYSIVDVYGQVITRDTEGILLSNVSEKAQEEYVKYPFKFVGGNNTRGADSNARGKWYSVYGLMEKDRIVVMYRNDLGYDKTYGGEYHYEAVAFYVFPTKDAYNEYVSMLKSMYPDEKEIYFFLDVYEKPLPLILVGNREGFESRDLPPFIKDVSFPLHCDKDDRGFDYKSFTSFNSYRTIETLNGIYDNRFFLGRYRYEAYNKDWFACCAAQVYDPLTVEKETTTNNFILRLGGKHSYTIARLGCSSIKLIPKHNAIVFGTGAFVICSTKEAYNEYVAMLKDIIINPKAQELIFIED